ncbi:hypothetical protein ACQ4PT_013795 [Festuca glaucescens]
MEDPGSPCPEVQMKDPESALLRAAMDAPFTASLGPMGPLLRQLHNRPKGVGDDKIQLLKDDLVGLCISLKKVSEAAGASFMAKWWMKEVRELCYDTQDYLDEAFVKNSGAGAGARRSARLSTKLRVGRKLEWRPHIGERGQGRCCASRLQQTSTKRRNLKRRPHKAAISFSELMARVEVLGDVGERFELGVEAIKPDSAQAGVSRLTPHRSLRLHSDTGGLSLVGAEEPVNKLVNMLAFDDDSQKQVKVVSIFGFAGVGKTTAATTLYRNFRGRFQCRAFVRVSRTPDMMGILTSILSQIKASQVRGFPDAQDLIDNIREHLHGKRYFIIIDDLWTTSVWNIISRAFPDEGYTIGKHDLVKQWVAEGFLGTMEEGQNTEKIAGAYFDELVSRGMVQAVNTNYSGEVLFCTVHQMFGGAKGAKIPEGIIISQVRSFQFFGFFKCVPHILGYGLLRVLILHIWADEDKIIDLSRISELCRLTYLKIKCNIIIKLPAKIGGIQDLETLEIDARLSAVPSDIIDLKMLLNLRLPSESYLPHEVGHMTCLRTLGYFDIGRNSEDNVMDLGKLTNLQDLQLTCSTVQSAQNLEKNLQLLGSILHKLSILQSITLVPTADFNANTLKDHAGTSSISIFCDSLSSVSLAPSLLERIEFSPRSRIFPRLPKWFEQLGKLHTLKIAVRELCVEDIGILKALPTLTALSLYVQTAPAEIIVFDKTGFLVLSYLKFGCTTLSLNFESDAMPNLLKLKLSFNATSHVEQHVTAAISIEHLSGLKEISTKITGAGAISIEQLPGLKHISTEMRSEGADPEWAWRAIIINHKNNPVISLQLVGCFLNGNPSMETHDKDEVEDNEEEPKPNDMRTLTQPFSSSHLLTPDILLDDFLSAEDPPFQSETDRVPSTDKKLIDMLTEVTADEAEAVGAVSLPAKEASVASSENSLSEGIGAESLLTETSPMTDDLDDGGPMQPDAKLHSRAIISLLLRPRNWNAPADRAFFLDSYEVGELCYAAEQIFMQEPTVLQLKAPVKVFGDLHGQFGDLMRLFDEFGYPSTAGDITYIDYLFLGDYVDRGQHSLETITLLLALKIEYPEHVHLIRGSHEAADINALFGFRLECSERMGESDGIWAWTRFNQLFNYLPLAAMIEKKIICMHGGIGRSINSVDQIEQIERPITMDVGSIILMDLLWSDPTENDSVEGLRPNARGPGLVKFGV